MDENHFDITIIGAGAAGLMSAIWAARTNPKIRIVLVDGAKKIGTKILVSGGGRCNITNQNVTQFDFSGGSQNAIKKVLQEFTSQKTIQFFNQIGVETKEEPLGKIFPKSNSSKEVVEKLLAECKKLNIFLRYPFRVAKVIQKQGHFSLVSEGNQARITCTKLILATGGRALPKSGSDGAGYEFAKEFGHRLTKKIFPALVPLTLDKGNFLLSLQGITLPTRLTIKSAKKKYASFEGSTLFTHFGISGPTVLNISRHLIASQFEDPNSYLEICFLPDTSFEQFENQILLQGNQSIANFLSQYLPQRLSLAILQECKIHPTQPVNQLPKKLRQRLLTHLFRYPLPVTGNRGYVYAEVTAGGIPLTEIKLNSMVSRFNENLFLCGEILNVDGRIGGFNFQWAWSSGMLAGKNAAKSLT